MLPPSPPAPNVLRVQGVELVGEYQGSGSNQPRYLLRRADGRMLEVSPLVYAVALNIDGERDLTGVASEATKTVGRRVSPENVAYLIEHKLRPLGIVAGEGSRQTTGHQPVLSLGLRRTLLGRRAVGAIAHVLRPLFRSPVVVAVLAGVIAADGWLLATSDPFAGLERVIYQPALLVLVWGLMALAGIFHELGHATASAYGGAAPGPIGVGIYLVWPAFYNNLTDSYRLSRSGRLRADLGGVYFNGVYILVLAGAYAATGFEPLLVAIALQHLVVAQQFLPFVRLDGYYVVSDVVGVPDLFAQIRPILRSMVSPREPDPSEPTLKPWALQAVTFWVVFTVPLLAAAAVLLALRLPGVLAVARQSIAIHAAGLVRAAEAGEPWLVLVSALQLAVLMVPFAGAALIVMRLLHRLVRARAAGNRSARDTRPPLPALTVARMNRVMAFSPPGLAPEARPEHFLSLGFGA